MRVRKYNIQRAQYKIENKNIIHPKLSLSFICVELLCRRGAVHCWYWRRARSDQWKFHARCYFRHQTQVGLFITSVHSFVITIRDDTRCYFNVRSKANMSQLNLPHRNNNYKV